MLRAEHKRLDERHQEVLKKKHDDFLKHHADPDHPQDPHSTDHEHNQQHAKAVLAQTTDGQCARCILCISHILV